MGFAFGQQAHQRAEPADPGQAQRAADQPPGPQRQRFDGVDAEMFVEPRAPNQAERVAGLQRRLQPRRTSAAHQAEMTAVAAGHRLDNRRGLAVATHADDDALVAPFHRAAPYGPARWRGGGILERRSAITSPTAARLTKSATTPDQPSRAKNNPPAQPTRLEPM